MHFPEELILSKVEISRWLKSDKKIFRVAMKVNDKGAEEQLVGYYAIFPLSLELYDRLAKHQVDEKSIRLQDFLNPYSGVVEAVYVLDLAKHDEEAVGAALLRDLVRLLAKIAIANPNLRKVGTWAFSVAGQSVAERLGMDRVVDYEDYEDTALFEISNPRDHLSSQSPSRVIRDILKSDFAEVVAVVA